MPAVDRSLDALLALDGTTYVITDAGHWVKFVVTRVPPTKDKPHGLDYSLTMHAPNGERLVGFDNAHVLPGKQARGGRKDHRHRLGQVKGYGYTDGGALITAFWTEVESVLKEKGYST